MLGLNSFVVEAGAVLFPVPVLEVRPIRTTVKRILHGKEATIAADAPCQRNRP